MLATMLPPPISPTISPTMSPTVMSPTISPTVSPTVSPACRVTSECLRQFQAGRGYNTYVAANLFREILRLTSASMDCIDSWTSTSQTTQPVSSMLRFISTLFGTKRSVTDLTPSW